MTSQERHEARYRRRQQKRQARRQARSDALGPLPKVFSYRKMFFYGRKCCNGVRWKQSTQNFELHLFSGTAVRRRKVISKKWIPKKSFHFMLNERGKVRPIDAPHITDRQVHKTLCNEVLTPLYTPSMIYDNGASQKGKGLHWHYKRLEDQLRWHFRRYGREGGVLLIDLKSFFPNAPHKTIYDRHDRLILNPDIRLVADTVVNYAPCTAPGRGMPLGVEPSQQEMVALPSKVDNWIKCQKGLHCAGHYMDDYCIIGPVIDDLKKLAYELVEKFREIGVIVNKKKCKLIPLTKAFRFCKAKFQLMPNGAVKKHGSRDGMKRTRRKLKLFYRKKQAGEDVSKDVGYLMNSQIAYYDYYNDHGRVLKLRRMEYAMFIKDQPVKAA